MAELFVATQSFLRGQAALAEVERALAEGADPNEWNAPLSPVKCAIQAHNVQLLRLLLRSAADPNRRDARGVGPLHVAVFEGKAESVRLLLDSRADPNVPDRHRQTPIFFAPSRPICELLLRWRADLSLRNAKAQSALHLAAHAGLNDVVACLADAAAASKSFLDAEDHKGYTAIFYARQSKVKSTAGLLAQKGADPQGRRLRQAAAVSPAAPAPLPPRAEKVTAAVDLDLASERALAKSAPPEEVPAPAGTAGRPQAEVAPEAKPPASRLKLEEQPSPEQGPPGPPLEAAEPAKANKQQEVEVTKQQEVEEQPIAPEQSPPAPDAEKPAEQQVEEQPIAPEQSPPAPDAEKPSEQQVEEQELAKAKQPETEDQPMAFEQSPPAPEAERAVAQQAEAQQEAEEQPVPSDKSPPGPPADAEKPAEQQVEEQELAKATKQQEDEEQPTVSEQSLPAPDAEKTAKQQAETQQEAEEQPVASEQSPPGPLPDAAERTEEPQQVEEQELAEAPIVPEESPGSEAQAPADSDEVLAGQDQVSADLVSAVFERIDSPDFAASASNPATVSRASDRATMSRASDRATMSRASDREEEAAADGGAGKRPASVGGTAVADAVESQVTPEEAEAAAAEAVAKQDEALPPEPTAPETQEEAAGEEAQEAKGEDGVAAPAEQEAVPEAEAEEAVEEVPAAPEVPALWMHRASVGTWCEAVSSESRRDMVAQAHRRAAAAQTAALPTILRSPRRITIIPSPREVRAAIVEEPEPDEEEVEAAAPGSPGAPPPRHSTKLTSLVSVSGSIKATDLEDLLLPGERRDGPSPDVDEEEAEPPPAPPLMESSDSEAAAATGAPKEEAAEEPPEGATAESGGASSSDALRPKSASSAPQTEEQLQLTQQSSQPFSGTSTSDTSRLRADEPKPSRKVQQVEHDGCLYWEAVLRKETVDDKYGFVQANGRLDFEQRLIRGKQGEAHGSASPPMGAPETLIVKRINQGGLLDAWNHRHPNAEVKSQDRIVSVNGELVVEEMQHQIRERKIAVKFCRYPELFAVSLTKGGQRLGFRFEKPMTENVKDLRISEVLSGGALPDHNARQAALGRWHFVVLADMRIDAVNGIEHDAYEMAEELKRCETALLHLRRAEVHRHHHHHHGQAHNEAYHSHGSHD